MRYRELGKTGLKVSVLSLGVSPFGGAFGPVDEGQCQACLDRALDLGINYFDTSPYYGLTRSEQVLGRCLRGVARDRFVLATKVGRYGDEEFDFSAARVRRSVDESLERLGVDFVDVIQCHDIEFASLDQVVEETLPALRDVVRQGKARFVGITGLPLRIFTEVVGRAEVDTVLSYCHYTLQDTTLAGVIPWLKERGVGIINASPLGMGLLTDQGPPDWHPAPEVLRALCRLAAEHCRRRGSSLARLALQFALANDDVATTLVGTARAEKIAENVRWLDEPLDPALLTEVRELLLPVLDRTWPSGRPENNGDPFDSPGGSG